MQIAVVIPCFKARDFVLAVIARIPSEVTSIHVVDDCCPEQTGLHVRRHCRDPRVRLVFHSENRGVGGATVSGYRDALAVGAEVIVKIDGDGQMDPAVLDRFVAPIRLGRADYSKGNRFFDIERLKVMPRTRLVGNSILSLINKLSSGYWNIADPANGYTAIHANVLRLLPLDRLDQRFFFESDLLFHLNLTSAVVTDVPLEARYGSEVSSLSITRVSLEFPGKCLSRLVKRLYYSYVLREFNAGTLALVSGLSLTSTGFAYGAWLYLSKAGAAVTIDEVMLSLLPILIGAQLLISAVRFDIMNVPTVALHPSLGLPDAATDRSAPRGRVSVR